MSRLDLDSEQVSAFPLSSDKAVGRRAMLKLLAGSGALLVGGAALASCGSSAATGVTNITLTSNGWPFDVMPTKEAIKKDASLKGYADSLKVWMDKNPGVTIKKVSTDIWNQEQITKAVSAGIAPTWFQGDVLGDWNDLNIRSAFIRGMAADLTSVVEKYQTEKKLAPYAESSFKSWKVNGKFYGTPSAFLVTLGVYYRRDLLKQLGMPDPEPTYTWQDIRKMAKAMTTKDRKGVALQAWLPRGISQANQEPLLSQVPTPTKGWHWRNDHVGQMDTWRETAELWRGMLNVDKSLAADVTYTDTQMLDQFSRGSAGIILCNSGFMSNMAPLEKKVGKPLDDIVGFISLPQGSNGALTDSQPFTPMLSFDPQLNRNQAALDKAYSLWDYMQFGQGYIDQKKATYDATKDIRKVYTDPAPLRGTIQIPGVPGTPEDALGAKFLKSVVLAGSTPLKPKTAWYFLPEKNPGPTGASTNDAASAIAYTGKDIASIIQNWDTISNKEMDNFTSSASTAEFKQAAQRYFADHDAFWKQHSPEFYSNVFQPWYEQKVKPAIS